jgi:hypothetical protein
MNPDQLKPGQRCASTSNRNFEGRQGYRGCTLSVSPQDGCRGGFGRPVSLDIRKSDSNYPVNHCLTKFLKLMTSRYGRVIHRAGVSLRFGGETF